MAGRPVYSVLLLGGTVSGGTSELVALPADFVYVVRDICATFTAPSGGPLGLDVEFDGLVIAHMAVATSVHRTLTWQGRSVAAGPNTIQATGLGLGGSIDVTVSGYQLTLP